MTKITTEKKMRLLTTVIAVLSLGAALALPIGKPEKEACTGHMGLEIPCFELVSKNKAYEVHKSHPKSTNPWCALHSLSAAAAAPTKRVSAAR